MRDKPTYEPAESVDAHSINRMVRMPNGCELRPGGKIRMLRKKAFQIPESVIEELGLELDDAAASHESEVVVWPLHPNRP